LVWPPALEFWPVRPVGLRLALPPPPGDAPLRPAGMLADIPCRDALRRDVAPIFYLPIVLPVCTHPPFYDCTNINWRADRARCPVTDPDAPPSSGRRRRALARVCIGNWDATRQ